MIYTCEHCGKKIKSYTFEDGTTMSAEEIVTKSKETYGQQLCMDCVFEASSAQSESDETEDSVDENSAESETAEVESNEEELTLPFN